MQNNSHTHIQCIQLLRKLMLILLFLFYALCLYPFASHKHTRKERVKTRSNRIKTQLLNKNLSSDHSALNLKLITIKQRKWHTPKKKSANKRAGQKPGNLQQSRVERLTR